MFSSLSLNCSMLARPLWSLPSMSTMKTRSPWTTLSSEERVSMLMLFSWKVCGVDERSESRRGEGVG